MLYKSCLCVYNDIFFHSANSQVVKYENIKKVALNAYTINSGVPKTELKIKEVIPIKAEKEVAY